MLSEPELSANDGVASAQGGPLHAAPRDSGLAASDVPLCGMEWTDEWPQVFKFEFPDCGVLVETIEVVEFRRR